jgi:hypothetical protein
MVITDYRGKKDRRSARLYSENTLTRRVEQSKTYTIRRDFENAIRVLSLTVNDLENARSLGYLDENSAGRVARYAWQSAHMLSGLADEAPEIDNRALSLIEILEKDFDIKKFPVTKKVAMAASILGFFGGIFMISPNLSLTGNAIGSNFLGNNLMGVALTILGLLGVFYSTKDQARMAWFEKKRHRDKDFRRDNGARRRTNYKEHENETYGDFDTFN